MVDLASILRCPRCKVALNDAAPDGCPACRLGFRTVLGQPVLIDFDNSIFAPEDVGGAGEQALPSASRLGRFLDRLTYGTNRVARGNVAALVEEARRSSERPVILIIGGGTVGSGVESLYADPTIELVGTDVYASPHTALVCDGHSLPFVDRCFDGVIIQAVLEHVLDPASVVAEIHRVLKPEGVVYADTPFLQQVHMGAYDFTRFTFGGHRWLFRNFRQIDAGIVSGPGIALLWSIAHFAKGLGLGNAGAALATAPFFWVRWLERRASRGMALDGASGTYFLGRKASTSLQPREMKDFYSANR